MNEDDQARLTELHKQLLHLTRTLDWINDPKTRKQVDQIRAEILGEVPKTKEIETVPFILENEPLLPKKQKKRKKSSAVPKEIVPTDRADTNCWMNSLKVGDRIELYDTENKFGKENTVYWITKTRHIWIQDNRRICFLFSGKPFNRNDNHLELRKI